MEIPFVNGAYTGFSLNVNSQRCVNLYPESDATRPKNSLVLYGTPGLVEFADISGVVYVPPPPTYLTVTSDDFCDWGDWETYIGDHGTAELEMDGSRCVANLYGGLGYQTDYGGIRLIPTVSDDDPEVLRGEMVWKYKLGHYISDLVNTNEPLFVQHAYSINHFDLNPRWCRWAIVDQGIYVKSNKEYIQVADASLLVEDTYQKFNWEWKLKAGEESLSLWINDVLAVDEASFDYNQHNLISSIKYTHVQARDNQASGEHSFEVRCHVDTLEITQKADTGGSGNPIPGYTDEIAKDWDVLAPFTAYIAWYSTVIPDYNIFSREDVLRFGGGNCTYCAGGAHYTWSPSPTKIRITFPLWFGGGNSWDPLRHFRLITYYQDLAQHPNDLYIDFRMTTTGIYDWNQAELEATQLDDTNYYGKWVNWAFLYDLTGGSENAKIYAADRLIYDGPFSVNQGTSSNVARVWFAQYSQGATRTSYMDNIRIQVV